jgi:pyruvate-formate lyase-activating enzyme/diadenosine tetraphosphatase ApaH/serine/threonine PP2A family protein phosphatase
MPRIAVFGGVYANPYALRALLDDARERDCDSLYCLGDLGGFGAECDAVWPLLREHDVTTIAGNYDVAIGRGDDDCGCGYADPRDNAFAQLMYDHTRTHTSAAFAAWMARLPGELRGEIGGVDVHMVHGSPLAINDFMWESLSDEELALRARPSGAELLLCTHTGIAWERELEATRIVNVGAVGRPANDGRPDVRYAVIDLSGGRVERVELVVLAYDWRAQAASMRAAGLPEPFVETIESGWWTTCLEIVPPRERARGAFHVYREALPDLDGAGAGWADGVVGADDGRPVVSLFGSALFPPRLWIYTNFHCNLACDYCVVASSPDARRRELSAKRFFALVDEAVREGFGEVYVTGGEPFVHPQITAMIEYACERLPTVVLTNAMLFTGRRRGELERLAGRAGLTLQSSLDGARAETHDRWRGTGSWARALDGLRLAAALGLPLRVAMTQTPDNHDDVEPLRALLEQLGITGDAFAVRPLVARGFAAGAAGTAAPAGAIEVSDAVMVPELTITADGAHWHPVGADIGSCPDFVVARGDVPLAEAKRLVIERFLQLRQADGSLPDAFACAV